MSRMMTIINYATYCAKVLNQNDELVYEENIHGMWTIERYVNLLMGKFLGFQMTRTVMVQWKELYCACGYSLKM